MTDTIIDNGYVITMNPDREIISRGAVAIDGLKIEAVGKTEDIRKSFHADRIIDATGKVVLPGFVCTHTHLWQILFRSLGADRDLFEWCNVIYGDLAANLQPEDCHAAAMIGSAELLKSGTTTVVDNHHPFPQTGLCDAIMRAFLDIGIRGIEALGAFDIDEMRVFHPSILTSTSNYVKELESVIKRWHGKNNNQTHVMLGTGATFINSTKFLKESRRLADKHKIGILMHLAETEGERDDYLKKHGRTSIEYLEDIGMLGPDFLGIHCIWFTDKDIELFKKYQCPISHNPVSNMYVSEGIAPISRYLKENLVVSLGVDGAASNDSQNMFEVMKLAALLQKVHTLDPLSITANQVFEMATIDGARSIGMENQIGSLEPGKYADIQIMNLQSIRFAPLNYIPAQIVYCGNPIDIDTVLVNGKIVVEKGDLTTANEQGIIRAAQKASDRLVKEAKLEDFRKRTW